MLHVRIAVCITVLLVLSGCDRGTPEYMLQDYMSRVSNTLDIDINDDLDVAGQIPQFPRKRERWRDIPPLTQGVIEVLDLNYCEGVIRLIAERNSNLGRVMQPSQQMTYEIRFYDAIRQCNGKIATEPAADPELKQRIAAIFQHKHHYLSDSIWNGIIGSDELAANFSRSEPPLPLEKPLDLESSLKAIERFSELAALPNDSPDNITPAYLDTIEESYQALHLQRYGARVMKSLILVTVTMENTAIAINQRLDQRPFCLSGHHTPKRDILRNVFSRYYAGQLQPYLAQVHRGAVPWFDAQRTLFSHFSLPEPIQIYFDQTLSEQVPDSLWRRYKRAIEQHTKAWQRLLAQCDMMPTAP